MGWSRWYTPLPHLWGPSETLYGNVESRGRSDLFRQDEHPGGTGGPGTQAWGLVSAGGELTFIPFRTSPVADEVATALHMQNDQSEYVVGTEHFFYRYVAASANERAVSFFFVGRLDERDYSQNLIQDLASAPYSLPVPTLGVDYAAIPGATDPSAPGVPAYVEFKPGMPSHYVGGRATLSGQSPHPWVQGDSFDVEVMRIPNVAAGTTPAWGASGIHLATLTYSNLTGLITGGLSGAFAVPELLAGDQVTFALRLSALDGPWPGFDAAAPTDNTLSLEFTFGLQVAVQPPDFRYWLPSSLQECPPHPSALARGGTARIHTESPVVIRVGGARVTAVPVP